MSDLVKGWRIQWRTIHALIVRDLMARYGRDNLGFGWAILEPMILTCGVMVIWTAMGHNKEGIRAVELVFTGYMPLTLWRHLTNSPIGIFRASSGMLYHRRVTPLDLVFARQTLEVLGTSAALLVIYSTLLVTGLGHGVENWSLFILGWLMMASISVAFGLWLAAITERYEVAERFIQPFQYLNIPISGGFFFVDWLPTWAQKLILLNPLAHCYEVFRAGYFGDAIVTHYSLSYFAAWVFALMFVGLRAVYKIRPHIRLQ